jgi:glucose-6-phosphate isomerase
VTHVQVVAGLVAGRVASRIAAADPTLWAGPGWPGWLTAARTARPMVGAVAALRDRLRVAGVHRVVLATAGGIGVTTEALVGGPGTGLAVLDTTDPESVADALAGDLESSTLVAVLAPDATAAESAGVDLLVRTVTSALRAEGLDAAERTVLVGAPDGRLGTDVGAATVLAGPPDVSGLWSSLTAYTLVPAGLAGIDVADVLTAAAATETALATDEPDNPALVLGAHLATAHSVALTGHPALAEWAAELVACGLGKRGGGPLPVLLEPAGTLPDGALLVELPDAGPGPGPALAARADGLRLDGPTGGRLLVWQRAVAVAAHLAGVDPTERPADERLPAADSERAFVDGAVTVRAGDWLPADVDTVADALRALVDPPGGRPTRLAVHAYLDRESDASAAVLRPELARRTGLTTTFGWAPRCLAGTGQYDRTGRDAPVVCQLTGAAQEPGEQPDELARLQHAAAEAQAAALARHGRRVLRLHLADRVAGLVTVAKAVEQL